MSGIELHGSIAQLGLPTYARHSLFHEGIDTVEKLLRCQEQDLVMLPKIGSATLVQIVDTLKRHGLVLGTVPEAPLASAGGLPPRGELAARAMQSLLGNPRVMELLMRDQDQHLAQGVCLERALFYVASASKLAADMLVEAFIAESTAALPDQEPAP